MTCYLHAKFFLIRKCFLCQIQVAPILQIFLGVYENYVLQTKLCWIVHNSHLISLLADHLGLVVKVVYSQQNQVILSDHPLYILAVFPYSPLAQLIWIVGNLNLLTLFLWVWMQYLIAVPYFGLCVTSGPLFHPSWQAMHSTLQPGSLSQPNWTTTF